MDTSTRTLLIAAALTAAAAAHGQDQTPPPANSQDPASASSPHQRSATGDESSEAPASPSPEASAAASPHQHEVASEKVSGAKLKMAKQDGAVPATFVKKAALDGLTEVELGNVALSKSKDIKVREFANRMVADHGKANDELATLAASKGLEVPKSLDAEHQAIVQALNSKSGAAFDSAYREHMNQDHREAIALFEGASQSPDAQLAAFAKQTLPTLQQHKKLAESLPSARTAEAEAAGPQAR